MSTLKLLTRSVLYYWRTNLAVLLGVVAGTAVIGGALIVGDSVRGSLRQMTFDRLGRIDQALSGQRFFRHELAAELSGSAEFQQRFARVAPAIAIRASATRHFQGTYDPTADPQHAPESVTFGGLSKPAALARAGQVNAWGVDQRLWSMLDHGGVAPPAAGEVVISSRLAEALREASSGINRIVQVGDEINIAIEIPASIPRDSLLGGDTEAATEVPLRVSAILPDTAGAGRLELDPNQQLPLNAYVNLGELQRELGLDQRRVRNRKRQTYIDKPARVNALFVEARTAADGQGDTADEAGAALTDLLRAKLHLADLGLRLVPSDQRGYLSLESEQQILAQVPADAAHATARSLHLDTSDVFVQLANQIEPADAPPFSDARTGYSMYSAVAGLEFPLEAPFGPFLFAGPSPDFPLAPDQIVINEWLAHDLGAKAGDRIRLHWYDIDLHRELIEQNRVFTVVGVAALDGGPADDEHLTPEVEGITDADSFNDWERQPFPLQTELITERDEAYWSERHATPKAFLQLNAAQDLWRSRYGQLTSIRIAPRTEQSLAQLENEFTPAFINELDVVEAGLSFEPVKFNGLQAASGTTDFAGLFLGFSFFLIMSAMILIGLLFRLGMERRSTNVGLLAAVGLPARRVRRLFLTEALLIAVAGGLLGIPAALGYAALMIYGLTTWWIGAIGTRFLNVYIGPWSLAIGCGVAVGVAMLAIWWALRQLRNVSARELLAGATERTLSARERQRRVRWSLLFSLLACTVCVVILAVDVSGLLPNGDAFMGISWQAVAFFTIGVLMLAASLSAFSVWLQADRQGAVYGRGLAGVARLGARNASRNRLRSLLTVGLIASAMFVVVAIAAGHRDPSIENPDLHSGNGGFLLVGETSTPIVANLNTRVGRDQVGLTFPTNATDTEPEYERKRLLRILIDNTIFMPFRVQPGENASCLNIYQTRMPTVLGVSLLRMVTRGGFRFVGADRENPWTLLGEPLEPVELDSRQIPVYPVFADQNTLLYSLHKGLGDTIPGPDAERPEYLLKVVGAFDGSVFQGVLVMSEANFNALYPDRAGYSYFLVAAPSDMGEELSNLLESVLSPYGFDAEPVGQRLARFLTVQNTYLSTFQTLGGLGLLVGTLGLGTVMLRNVLERRGELALLRSVGFQRSRLGWMVLWENSLLLVWGILAGTVSALLAMWPHLTTRSADVPWLGLATILAAVFVIGMAAALLAVTEAVRTPIVETLRGE